MDAINKKQRTLAIWQFAFIYGCSMIIPFVAAAFFFSTPTDTLEQENEKLRIALSEQVKLNVRLEKMVKQLASLEDNDKAYLNATTDLDRGNLKRSIDESENMIRSAVYDLKRDTASFKEDSAKIFSKNILLLVDATLTYRNTIAYLREALQKNGVNTQAVDKLNAELSARDDKIHGLEVLLAQAVAARPVPSSGGGGGAGTRNGDRAADCALYVSRWKSAEDEITRLRAVNSGNNAGSNTNTSSASESSVREKTTSEFIDMLIQRGDDSKKPPCARKPMYELAIETLNKSSKAEARNKIEDLNKKIRKISD